jgi:hypothetical protein
VKEILTVAPTVAEHAPMNPVLLDQATARRTAKALTEGSPSLIYVAATYPLTAWGGTEQGWAVYLWPSMIPMHHSAGD